MTEDKARKRAIRARMAKTGERYTAARRQLVGKTERAEMPPATPQPADDPGLSDQAVRTATGKGWDEWVRILDAWGATTRPHGEIARYVSEEHGVPGWWTQAVVVGYERIRGMREKYQTSRGFQVSVSKTLPADAAALFQAFVDDGGRDRWLEPGTLRVRTSQEGRTARFDFGEGGSRVVVGFIPKGRGKATVSLAHERLPDAAAVEEMRAFWKERLARLADVLRP